MLELLAGPFDILDLDGNSVVDPAGYPIQGFYYDDDLGLMFSEGWLNEVIWLIQMDGTAAVRSQFFGRFIVDLQPGRLGEYLVTNPPYESKLHLYEKRSGTYSETLLSLAGLTPLLNVQVRCEDRFIGIGTPLSTIKTWPLDMSQAAVTEATLTGAGSGIYRPQWSRTRDANILAIAFQNGNVLYYDHVQKQQADGFAYIGANLGAWYSPRHNVFLKLTTDRQLEIYANAPRPYSLSNPSGDAPARGRMTTYTVRVLGAQNEPCPNEIIDWSLDPGDPGQLRGAQSSTDSDGYASIDYFAPVIGSLGSITVNAEIKF